MGGVVWGVGFLMRVGFISMDWAGGVRDNTFIPLILDGEPIQGGSGHVRIGQYIPYFPAYGIQPVFGLPVFDERTQRLGVNEWPGRLDFDFDVIYMQRLMSRDHIRQIKAARASGQIVINDVDDWYWDLGKNHITSKNVDPTRSPDTNIDIYRQVLSLSDAVVVSSEFLKNKISEWNSFVKIHYNFVNTAAFARENTYEQKDRIVIGWTGSIPFRSGADLKILRPYSKEITKFARWHHSGGASSFTKSYDVYNRFFKQIGVEAPMVTESPIVPPTMMAQQMCFDVGIVPLEDIPFNHAKSYMKGIEYSASGLPFVASPLPQYIYLKNKYDIGVVVDHPSQYVDELRKCLNASYREEQGQKNLELVIKHLDVIDGAGYLSKTIKSIVNKTVKERKKYAQVTA